MFSALKLQKEVVPYGRRGAFWQLPSAYLPITAADLLSRALATHWLPTKCSRRSHAPFSSWGGAMSSAARAMCKGRSRSDRLDGRCASNGARSCDHRPSWRRAQWCGRWWGHQAARKRCASGARAFENRLRSPCLPEQRWFDLVIAQASRIRILRNRRSDLPYARRSPSSSGGPCFDVRRLLWLGAVCQLGGAPQ